MFKTHRVTERQRERKREGEKENSWLWRVCAVGNLVIPGHSILIWPLFLKTSATLISSSAVRNVVFGNRHGVYIIVFI
jgi:hypothetical protein